jgi:hypothetical protein
MNCLYFLKELLRNFLLMDMSAVILIKPVHIHSLLKALKEAEIKSDQQVLCQKKNVLVLLGEMGMCGC